LNGFIPSGVPIKTPYAFLFSLTYATCPTHLILHDLAAITIPGEDTNHKALHCAIFSSFLLLPPSGAYFLSTIFLTILCPHSYPRTPFHTYLKQHTKIKNLCILIFMFLDSK
jgi:hypothetical protein